MVVGEPGYAPRFLPCHGSGLLLTYPPWSGSADLHRASPTPQIGGTLPSLEPDEFLEGPPGVAPGLTGPQPVVQTCYTSAPRLVHREGFAPPFRAYRARVLLLDDRWMEGVTGLAPALRPWQGRALLLRNTPE